MKARFFLGMIRLMILTSLLSGCGIFTPPPKPPTTIINPATISLGKTYHDEGTAEKHEAKITISPPMASMPPATTIPPATLPAPTLHPVAPVSAPPGAGGGGGAGIGGGIAIPFNGGVVMAPPGSALTFETTDSGNPAKSDYSENADGVGASLHTDGDKGNFDASAPKAELGNTDFTGINGGAKGGKSSGTGGTVKSDWVSKIVAALPGTTFGVKMCWLVGLGLILAAAAYVGIELMMRGLPDWELAGLGAGLGVAIIIFGVVAETYPWVFLILFILGIAAIVWYVYRWKMKQTTTTSTTTTATNVPPAVTPSIVLNPNLPAAMPMSVTQAPIVQAPTIKLTT